MTAERNLMKLKIDLCHYNDVIHIKLGQAGFSSS